MRMRQWSAWGAVAVLALGTVACGDDDDDSSSDTSADSVADATDVTSAASSDVTSPAEETTPAQTYTVGINRYGTFDVLDDALNGLQEELAALGYVEGENLTYDLQNPEFDAAQNTTIAQQFVDEDVDVMVGFATPPTQAMMSASSTIPIVFVASSTPVESELVASLDAPGGNVTGVADILPIEEEIDLMLQIMPDMQTVGLIWNSGDTGGENLYKRAKAHLDELGLESIEAPITGSADAVTSVQSLIGRVDAIELPCDSETLAGVEAILTAANDAKIPVFGCTGEAVSKGAILAGAFDYTEVGREAARLIDQILKGADPGTLAVVVPTITGPALNLTVAEQLGLDIPAEIRDAAVKTY